MSSLVAILTVGFILGGFFYVFKMMALGRARVVRARDYQRYVAPADVPHHEWHDVDPSAVPSDVLEVLTRGWAADRVSIRAASTTTVDSAAVIVFELHVSDPKCPLTFGCARVKIPHLSLPQMSVRATKLTGAFVAAAAGPSSVQLESDEFNHAFRIDTTVPAFAYEMLDGGMIELLLSDAYLCVLAFAQDTITLSFSSNHTADGTRLVLRPSEALRVARLDESSVSTAISELDAARCGPEYRLGFICSLLGRLPQVVRTKYLAE